jgi:protein-S-isoprenylcysteine O-methyltransferase Ste14
MKESVPAWAKLFATFQNKTIWDFPGKKTIKAAWAVNLHKVFTIFIIYGMMEYFNNFSVGAWVYLSLHGVYGFCWLIKDLGFRDHRLENKMSIGGFINLYIFLIAWYWIIPYLFISQYVEPSGFELFVAVSLHTLGVVLMIAADGQRHYSIKFNPGLITGGVFRYTRNPNYLGEVMLYSAYAFLANHWIAWAIVAYATITTFFPNMYNKEASISRHPGWKEYKASSGLIIPWRLLNGVAIVDVFRKK